MSRFVRRPPSVCSRWVGRPIGVFVRRSAVIRQSGKWQQIMHKSVVLSNKQTGPQTCNICCCQYGGTMRSPTRFFLMSSTRFRITTPVYISLYLLCIFSMTSVYYVCYLYFCCCCNNVKKGAVLSRL